MTASINESIDGGIPQVRFTLRTANTQQAPVDSTLSIAGMAADAKATGDAIETAKTLLQDEINDLGEDIAGVLGQIFPVGTVLITTTATAPAINAEWIWAEILIPMTWGDLEDGSRSYADKTENDTAGTLHFWRRTA